MELTQVANYINGRYLLTNIKKDKKSMLGSALFKSYSVDPLGNSVIEDVYYDTPDSFFFEKGIIICISSSKTSKELIVKYDDQHVSRIEFLKNIPNYFKMIIGKNDTIRNYYSEINTAIHKVFPSGLSVNIEDLLRISKPQIIIQKKRESFKIVNNDGLKMTLNFDNCVYINSKPKKKYKNETLNVVADDFKTKEDFNKFLKYIIRDFPLLLKINSNEFALAKSYF